MCIDTYVVIMLNFIGINEEKEICLPNKEYISGTEGTNMVAKCIVQITYYCWAQNPAVFLVFFLKFSSGWAYCNHPSVCMCLLATDLLDSCVRQLLHNCVRQLLDNS